ncbi:hypothetical protein MAR_035515 [Mya arenaria]|uniref:Uncharacterized protein n=1 Tax=Mya arenaria TaxID=6604 RepID=A0ABY7EMW6_MYAAR|nr:hypothetical protein MAR_035515 [Mya arenaria]
MFTNIITDTMQERLENVSIECLCKVGVCQPPLIVAPITVNPTKPNIPRVVRKGAYFTYLDDKSGFNNIKLSEHSYQYDCVLLMGWILFFFQNFGIWIQAKQLRLPHLKFANAVLHSPENRSGAINVFQQITSYSGKLYHMRYLDKTWLLFEFR